MSSFLGIARRLTIVAAALVLVLACLACSSPENSFDDNSGAEDSAIAASPHSEDQSSDTDKVVDENTNPDESDSEKDAAQQSELGDVVPGEQEQVDNSFDSSALQADGSYEHEQSTATDIVSDSEQALQVAINYLEHGHYSYDGLVKKLERAEFSHDDAIYAADSCGVDWNKQALAKAEEYLGHSGYSYITLVEQLKFDGFTEDQATYGVDNCNVDWFHESALRAGGFLGYPNLDREYLIELLVGEGFSYDQASYGASAVGF